MAVALAEIAALALLVPLGALAVDWLIRRSGSYAVANEDLLSFALTPLGATTLFATGVIALATTTVARAAGVMALLSAESRGGDGGVRVGVGGVVAALREVPRLLRLAAREAAMLAVILVPTLALLGGIAWVVLRGVDLYWLVETRPLRFWVGVALAAPMLCVAGALVLRLLLRWSLALPLLLVARRSPAAALRESADRVAGRLWTVAIVRGSIALSTALSGVLLLAVLRAFAERILAMSPTGHLVVAAVIAGVALALHAGAAALISMVATAADVAVVTTLWQGFDPESRAVLDSEARAPREPSRRGRLTTIVVVVGGAIAATTSTMALLAITHRPIDIEVTAHRGAARSAPENTIAAIRAAIAEGADRIEFDVMLSADGEVVLFHDTDLRRIAGDPRRVDTLTLEELRAFDVGRWFGESFAGTRMPTLVEALAAAVDDAGRPFPLNIELKVSGGGETLVEAVSEILAVHRASAQSSADGDQVRDRGRDDIIVTALSMAPLEAFRVRMPEIPVGLIVTFSIGDLKRLDVDLLSVDARIATSSFIARATRAGLPVHVWGVAGEDALTRLVLGGAAGVITSDVAGTRTHLDELAGRSELERLLLGFRVRLLGG